MAYLASYSSCLPNGTIKCVLCPHYCHLALGQKGLCGVRSNQDNKLVSENYGLVASVAADRVEKKPLRRFMSGTYTLSVGSYGCNLRCPWCQNYEISQQKPQQLRAMRPEQIVELAKQYEYPSISFTYNEPVVGYEFVYDTARLAQEAGLKTILVTAGYLNEGPWRGLLPYIDALNIDLKHFYNTNFNKVCGGNIECVKKNIELASQTSHIEITTLIVPGFNDDILMLKEMFKWLASICSNIPIHISRYFPRYRYHEKATEVNFIHQAIDLAKQYLKYVYAGNCYIGDGLCS